MFDKSKLIIKKLDLDELDAYLEFVSFVKENMEHPEWLGDFSKSDYVKMINNNAVIYVWTTMDNINKELEEIDQFVACGMLIPAKRTDMVKFMQTDLNYKEVIDFGPEIVHPKYVGNGIQRDVLEYLEIIAKGLGYKHFIGTVDPDNIYSIRNLLKMDWGIVNKVELSRGTRLVLRKDV